MRITTTLPSLLALATLTQLASCVELDDAPDLTAGDGAAELAAPPDLARASVLAADALLASSIALAGEADGLWPWLADDAAYLHPGADVIIGRDPSRAFLRATYPDPAAQTMTLHRVAGDVSADARLGYTFGWFDEVAGGAAATGKYIAVWTRVPGTWRLAAFARVRGSRAPSPTPAGAGILDGEHGVPLPGAPAAIAAQAMAADAAFAALSVSQGYTVAFSAYCSDSAVVVAGSDFYWDRAGVEYAWSGWSPAENLAWAPQLGGGAASGDLAYTVGLATYTYDDGTVHEQFYSKYLTVWIREASGAWHWLLDGGSTRPAPSAP